MQARGFLRLSIGVALVTIVLKTAAWHVTGSVGLLSDAMESVVNLAGAAFALWMVTIAQRPPDAGHPYGHHKAEYFSSAFEGALIFVAALGIAWAAIERFRAPQPLGDLGLGIGLSVVASAANGTLAFYMLRQARVDRSMALEGDARHLFADVWTSVGVIAGVLGVAATGWLWLDPLVAVAVALNVLREGYTLVRRSMLGLMDSSLEPEVMREVDAVLDAFRRPPVRFDHVSSRRAGRRRFVDLHLHIPAHWTLGRAAALRSEVERALLSSVPGLRVTIQLLPLDVEAQHVDELAPDDGGALPS